jgi:hypothetical protein
MKPSEYIALVNNTLDEEVARGSIQRDGDLKTETLTGKTAPGLYGGTVYGMTNWQWLRVEGEPVSLSWGVQRTFHFTGRIYIPEDQKLDVNILKKLHYIDSGVYGYLGVGYHFQMCTDLDRVTEIDLEEGSKIKVGMDIKEALPLAFRDIQPQMKRRLTWVGK